MFSCNEAYVNNNRKDYWGTKITNLWYKKGLKNILNTDSTRLVICERAFAVSTEESFKINRINLQRSLLFSLQFHNSKPTYLIRMNM